MATASAAKISVSPHNPIHFTPIEEGNEDDEFQQGFSSFRATTPSEHLEKRKSECKHLATPLHSEKTRGKGSSRKRQETDELTGVLCNKCRPSNREKIFSVGTLDNNGVFKQSMVSPNAILRSVLGSLGKKSPRLSDGAGGGGSTVSREEQLKNAVAELSNKLIQVTRSRDEAVLESSKLKFSTAELEKKLNKLEIYCHSLKSGLQVCSNGDNSQYQCVKVGDQEKVIQHFLVLVSEARSSVRILSRALSHQIRQTGVKVFDKISLLLQSYDVKISFSRNPRALLFYMEALLNRALFEDFESIEFQKSASNQILNPIDRCEANFAMFARLQGLTWEEVLNNGTRHFSEDFSKFCDRKMSEIVAMLGWNRAWPEPLLQAFFGASKAVWLVHLLANSVHPGLPIFRVDKGANFDPIYMEDMNLDKVKRLIPTMVRIMVTPGFYVYDNVIKCKVLCRYCNSSDGIIIDSTDKGSTPSP